MRATKSPSEKYEEIAKAIEILSAPIKVSDEVENAISARRLRETDLAAARDRLNFASKLPHANDGRENVEVAKARAALAVATDNFDAAKQAYSLAREKRDQEFAAEVFRRLQSTVETLDYFSGLVTQLVDSLDGINFRAFKHGIECPSILSQTPMLRDLARVLQKIANRV